MMRLRPLIAASILGAVLMLAITVSHASDSVRVMVFPGLQNLPIFAAQAKGLFERRNLAVEVLPAPTSDILRGGLIKNDHQIVHGAVDNALAMADVANADIAVLMGGDNGWNHIFTQADTLSIKDLRGKTVIVDAPVTAYAFQVYEVLKRNGLNKGDYEVRPVGSTFRRFDAMKSDQTAAASTLNPPFSILARRAGLKDTGEVVKTIGPYQATAAWVMRPWAESNSDVVVRYIQAYVEGLRWVLDPQNKAEAIALLADRLKLAPDVAAESYAIATNAKDGMAKDAMLDMDGFRNVIKLRADWTGKSPSSPERYIDLSYYSKALSNM
jgi:ABC-type nitrate/sulfonate/bicarbonate transport system substrate-binding protein